MLGLLFILKRKYVLLNLDDFLHISTQEGQKNNFIFCGGVNDEYG